MEVLRGAAIGAKVEEFRSRPTVQDADPLLPFTVAELTGLGIDAEVAAEAVRLTSDDEILDLAADLPEWQQRVLMELATGTSLDDVRVHLRARPPRSRRRPAGGAGAARRAGCSSSTSTATRNCAG